MMGLDGLERLQSAIDKEWIRIHGPATVFVGDVVEAVSNITRWDEIIIPQWTELNVSKIKVYSQEWNGLGFKKRIAFHSIDGEFNPQRFRLKSSE